MTKDEAIERVAKALVTRHGYRPESWKDMPLATGSAPDIVAALIALDLLQVD